MLILDVINRMLGTMGEVPLNSLADQHAFKGAGIAKLESRSTAVQARGWWFNKELLTLTPSTIDQRIYLPGDVTNLRVPGRTDIVQRGRMLYDVVKGTAFFTEGIDAVIIRKLPFESLPEVVADYIAAAAVLSFQTGFDGDSNKMRVLASEMNDALRELNAEETRQVKYNMLSSNPRLQLLKSRTYQRRIR